MKAKKTPQMNHQTSDLPAEAPAPRPRAALYMRVSTGRQAEHDLSIPDQTTQLKTWCRANGYTETLKIGILVEGKP